MPDPSKNCPVLLISCAFNHDVEYLIGSTGGDGVSVDGVSGDGVSGDGVSVKCNKVCLLLGKEKSVGKNIRKLDVVTDSAGDTVLIIFDDEKVMIEELFNIIRSNDIVIGYNINGFDFPYIIDRCKFLGIKDIKVGNGNSRLYYRKHISKGMSVVNIGGLTGKIVFDVLYLLRREDSSNSFKQEGRYNLKRLTLRDVAREILGKEKLDFSIEDMDKYWVEGCPFDLGMKMVEYGIRDAELPLELFRKFRLIDRFFTLSRRSGKLVGDIINSMGSGLMVENLLMKANITEGRVTSCRSRRGTSDEESEDELSGAEVFEPKPGISENVVSFDYKSLYPSLIIRHNLCYTTVIMNKELCGVSNNEYIMMSDDNTGNIAEFMKKEIYEGVIPRILKDLLNERAYWKKEMKKYEKDTSEYLLYDATQNAVKILLNSFYGYCGDVSARTYNWYVASAVTSSGRRQIIGTKKIIEDEIGVIEVGEVRDEVGVEIRDEVGVEKRDEVGVEKRDGIRKFRLMVVAGDTDSSYISVTDIDNDKADISRDECMYCSTVVLNKVNSILEKPMELAFENYIKRMFIVAKKHYAYVSVDDSGRKSITSKGMENIRRDWSNLATDVVAKIIDNVLMEEKVKDGISKSVELVKGTGRMLLSGEIGIEKLILTKKLTKAITEYDGKQAHVIVAKNMEKRGKSVSIGDRIEFVIIDNGKELITEKAEDWRYVVENGLKIDYNYYVNKQLIPPSMRILELLGVNKDEIVVGIDGKQKSLSEFWS